MIEHNQPLRFTWKAFSLWVVVTVLGYILGGDFHYQPDAPTRALSLRDIGLSAPLVGFLMSAVAGTIIAFLQWLVLKAWIPAPRLWILSNLVAYGLVHALNDALPYHPFPFPLMLLAGGFIVGTGQAVALRPLLSRAVLWLPLAAGAWLLSIQLGLALESLVFGNPLAEVFVGHGAAGLVTGVITGLALKRMLAGSVSQPGARSHPVKIAGGRE